MKRNPLFLTQAAIIAAAYIVLTLPFAQFSFGQIQFRLSEALTVLAALTPSAIPGLFIGCLLTNTFFNPSPLGLIDILFGSLATLLASILTWALARRLLQNELAADNRQGNHSVKNAGQMIRTALVIAPAVVVNALVVGGYLPFLLLEEPVTLPVVLSFMFWIFASEAVVVYLIGWPLLGGLRRTRIIRQP